MLYGQGAVGGILNQVSKRPQAEAAREIGISYGNYQRKQIQADLTGPIDEEGKWLYRVVALGRDSNASIKHVKDDRYFIAPSLTYRPSASTSLTLLANSRRTTAAPCWASCPGAARCTASRAGASRRTSSSASRASTSTPPSSARWAISSSTPSTIPSRCARTCATRTARSTTAASTPPASMAPAMAGCRAATRCCAARSI